MVRSISHAFMSVISKRALVCRLMRFRLPQMSIMRSAKLCRSTHIKLVAFLWNHKYESDQSYIPLVFFPVNNISPSITCSFLSTITANRCRKLHSHERILDKVIALILIHYTPAPSPSPKKPRAHLPNGGHVYSWPPASRIISYDALLIAARVSLIKTIRSFSLCAVNVHTHYDSTVRIRFTFIMQHHHRHHQQLHNITTVIIIIIICSRNSCRRSQVK